jgi:hypothetical protein
MIDKSFGEVLSDVRRYLARAKLSVVKQSERVDRLRGLGLPTADAEDTLDVLEGTVVALMSFGETLRRFHRGAEDKVLPAAA